MTDVVIMNPGAGPLEERAILRRAWKCIRAFRRDLAFGQGEVKIERVPENDDKGGRYGFRLIRDEYTCEVEMPGFKLEAVRYVREPDQNIWDFPRLYVDGSSFVWYWALENAKRTLLGVDHLEQLWEERQRDDACLCVLEQERCINSAKCRLKGHTTVTLKRSS